MSTLCDPTPESANGRGGGGGGGQPNLHNRVKTYLPGVMSPLCPYEHSSPVCLHMQLHLALELFLHTLSHHVSIHGQYIAIITFLPLSWQWLFSHDAKCAIWIIIWIAQFELSFEWRYFGPCVCQITSWCVIWNTQFKWRSGGVFQLRISQITQGNRRMNALTDKLCFGGGATWPSNHLRLYTACCTCTEAQEMWAPCMFDWQGTQTFFSRSRMLNPKFGLSCVHCVIQI